jgi:hypothetical protein
MGFIGKLISGIFSLIGGIFGGIGKLLGVGKKSEYFLEAGAASAPSASKSDSKSEPAKKAEPAKASTAKAEQATNPITPKAVDKAVELTQETTTASTTPELKPQAAPTIASKPAPSGTFAPDFLLTISSTNGRRRPGPSMDYFRNLAKQVKS